LKRSPIGSFLIRLGHSEQGGYAVSRVKEVKDKDNKPTKEVTHMRIQYTNEKFCFSKHEYDDLDKLVEGGKTRFNMIFPCLGSPFTALFAEDGASQKHHYYDDEDEEGQNDASQVDDNNN
jgi:hypothetical protein